MKSFAAALVACTATAVMLDENDLKFVQFMTEHAKEYNSMGEYNLRKARFLEINAEIERLNSSQSDSRHAHNFLSDRTHDEMKTLLMLNSKPPSAE
jgi:predicted transcriptional regulator